MVEDLVTRNPSFDRSFARLGPNREPPFKLNSFGQEMSYDFHLFRRIDGEVGVRAGNLSHLGYEYWRTERRAKALENVLMPKVDETMSTGGCPLGRAAPRTAAGHVRYD